LHVEGAAPVFVVDGKPLIACFPVRPDQVKFGTAAGSPAEFEFDDTAGSDEPGLNHRA
jgi:hypothetical protein